MFTVTKMTLMLKDGRIVEIDFNNPNSPVVATSAPITPEEEANLSFRLGSFLAGGETALNELEKLLNQ